MGDGPVHVGRGKIILAGVVHAHQLGAETGSQVPVELGPIAAFAKGLGLDQIVVDGVVDLLGLVDFEGADLGDRVADVALGLGDEVTSSGSMVSPRM